MICLECCRRCCRTLVLLLMAFVVATPLIGSPVFVMSALQRSEFYAGLHLPPGVLTLAPDPVPAGPVPATVESFQAKSDRARKATRVARAARAAHAAHAQAQVQAQAHKGMAKLSVFNVFLHLSGIADALRSAALSAGAAGGWRAVVRVLPAWDLVFAIFEPPRSATVLR